MMQRDDRTAEDRALLQIMWIEDRLGIPIGHRAVFRRNPPQEALRRIQRGSGGVAAHIRAELGANWFADSVHAVGNTDRQPAGVSCDGNVVRMLSREHEAIPDAVRALSDPPVGLRVCGRIDLMRSTMRVAIVGSRRPRADSASIARRIAAQLASQGAVIVSGLAVGVDTAAHRGALDSGGSTIAVLGSGLASVYPASNRALATHIVERSGALVSEYPGNATARPHQFAARNRIIAALAHVVVVIQAREQSGSMITARRAEETNADIGVVPGWVGDPEFMGSLGLIRDGATVVTEANDVLRMLGCAPRTSAQLHRFGSLLDAPRSIDELSSIIGSPTMELYEELLELELSGLITPTPDGRWINHVSPQSEPTSAASLR